MIVHIFKLDNNKYYRQNPMARNMQNQEQDEK